MRPHLVAFVVPLVSVAVALVPRSLSGQARSLPAAPEPTATPRWNSPRTFDGRPDLQGIWTNATVTPLERPLELAGKEFFSEQEAAELRKTGCASGPMPIAATVMPRPIWHWL